MCTELIVITKGKYYFSCKNKIKKDLSLLYTVYEYSKEEYLGRCDAKRVRKKIHLITTYWKGIFPLLT